MLKLETSRSPGLPTLLAADPSVTNKVRLRFAPGRRFAGAKRQASFLIARFQTERTKEVTGFVLSDWCLKLRLVSLVLIGFIWTLEARAAEPEPVELRTLTGQTIKGNLESITDKDLVISGNGPVKVDQVVDLVFSANQPQSGDKYSDVELTDGSLLHCSQFILKGNKVELKLVQGVEIKDLPLAAISYILSEAQEPKNREEWQKLLSKRGKGDLLAIKAADGVVNPLEGTLGEGDTQGETIEFETSTGKKARPRLDRIHGMAFLRQPGGEAAPTLCKAHDLSRDVLVVAQVAMKDNGYTLTTVAGAKVDFPLKSFTRWDFSKGKLTYLSDLEAKPSETSNVNFVEHYRRDKNLDGEPIRLPQKNQDGVTALQLFPKGLSLHAYTELLYDIGGEYKEFKAVLGVDPKVQGDSHVKLTIEGDGKELFAAEISRKDEPKPITLDIKNVKQLRLVVASAGLLDLGNHVSLADAKV